MSTGKHSRKAQLLNLELAWTAARCLDTYLLHLWRVYMGNDKHHRRMLCIDSNTPAKQRHTHVPHAMTAKGICSMRGMQTIMGWNRAS